jgi:hypothetical protein
VKARDFGQVSERPVPLEQFVFELFLIEFLE